MSKRPRPNSIEDKMTDALDELAAYEQYRTEILPELREALSRGATAEEISAKYAAVAAARVASIAAKEADSGKALAAAKDLLDRVQGKAKERTEVKHKFENLKDEQLDSLLLSQLGELDEDSEDNLQ